MKHVWWVALVVLAAGCRNASAPASEGEGESSAPVSVETASVTIGPVDETLEAPGTIAAQEGANVRVAPLFAGRIARVFVREGDRVAAGQPIAALEPSALAPQARAAAAGASAAREAEAQAQLEGAAASAELSATVRAAELSLAASITEREAAVQSARDALAVAESEQRRIDAGPRPQELAEAEAALRQAMATLSRARIERERVDFLVEKGVLARRQRDDAQTAVAVAESEADAARGRLSLVREGARGEERAAARDRTVAARNAVSQATALGDARVRLAQAALNAARSGAANVAAKRRGARVQGATAAQREAESAAASLVAQGTLLRAPISGTVVRRLASAGDPADPASPIVELTDLARVVLVAGLPGLDAARVRVGAPARVRCGARSVRGVVRTVGVVDPGTGLASVRIAITGEPLPVGAFAAAAIIVRHAARALFVPSSAIVNQGGRTVVYALDGGKAKRVDVRVGVERDGTAEVRGALTAGAAVVSVGAHELSDGVAVTVGRE